MPFWFVQGSLTLDKTVPYLIRRQNQLALATPCNSHIEGSVVNGLGGSNIPSYKEY